MIFEIKFNYINCGTDENSGVNYGGNIFLPDITYENKYGNYIRQGLRTNIYYIEARIAYLINSKTNLRFELAVSDRMQRNKISGSQSIFYSFSLKTNIFNHYYDF